MTEEKKPRFKLYQMQMVLTAEIDRIDVMQKIVAEHSPRGKPYDAELLRRDAFQAIYDLLDLIQPHLPEIREMVARRAKRGRGSR